MSKFKVGDTVTLIQGKSTKKMAWLEEMNIYVGKEFIIKSVRYSSPSARIVYKMHGTGYYFAKEWLKKVKSKDDKVERSQYDFLLDNRLYRRWLVGQMACNVVINQTPPKYTKDIIALVEIADEIIKQLEDE